MRHQFAIFCLLLSAISYAQTIPSLNEREARRKAAIGKPYPSFKAENGDAVLTKDSLKGKIVFINFWFEACKPCIAEMEGLNQLYDSLKDYKDFEFISFTYESPKVIEKMREKYGMKYKILSISRSECLRLNQNNGYPTSIVLDRKQKIKDIKTGGAISVDQATQYVMSHYYPLLLEELDLEQ